MADAQLDRVTSALKGHYEVQRKLGEGGMATVYLARDVKHDRLVAVKVLHPDLAASVGADRFLREIQITAKLSHPHILPLFDSGAVDGLLYYVMPLVEGETLADYMLRERQLPIPEAVKITREVAEALAQAHSYGLVHRDVKPSNIMMTGGHAVVADFGIARAVEEAGAEKLTQTGLAIGTPAYMSPEQAAGDPNLDGRSDIYSLGCVLYEMLVGQIPFTGPSPQAIIARHSMDHVPPPRIMRDTIPDELEDVIYRAMAKTPADRYRTALELAEALSQVDTSAPLQRRPSAVRPHPSLTTRTAPARRRAVPRPALVAASVVLVTGIGLAAWQLWPSSRAVAVGGLDPQRLAVLYFLDLTPNAEQQHLADALTEGLIDELSTVRALSVVSPNGVAPLRENPVALDSVGRLLGAGSIIDGTVEQTVDRVRVNVRLVDGESGADIDRAAFTLPAGDLLAVRDSVVQRAARFLRERLGEEVRLRERRAGTASVAAWTLVQRAERLRKDAEAVRRTDAARALALLGRADSALAAAEAADAGWAEPAVLRARVAQQRAAAVSDARAAVAAIGEGIGHATRALSRDPNNARAREARGALHYQQWALNVSATADARAALLDRAQEDFEAAVLADPSLASAHNALSRLHYARKNRLAAALAARQALANDAYLRNADETINRLFWAHHDLAQFTEARRWCLEGARRFPDDPRFTLCQLYMMITPIGEPDPRRAWQLLARADSLTSAAARPLQHRVGQMIVGGVLARAGLADSARRVLVAARAGFEVDPHQELYGYEAIMRTLLGDHDEAIDRLQRYVAANPGHAFLEVEGELHWWWRPLGAHPKFTAVRDPGR